MVLALLIAACVRDLPERTEAPARGDLEIGVAYAATISCAIPFKLGDTWWAFDPGASNSWPPDITIPPWPFSLWANVRAPYPVPGIVTLSSPTEAVFRADVDGTELPLSATGGPGGGGCL